MKQGFKAGCRKVIGLDGCFFKGACQGELLAAIARDANNQMYPVAWAVVEKETNDSWAWFIGLLIKDLDINDQGAGWVFISDKQKFFLVVWGLINSMRDYLPRAEHRMCARHIYANWRKKHKDHELQKRLWAIAKSGNREYFNYNKAKLAHLTPEGAKDIMKTDPKHWARAFFPIGAKCESVDNNLCESFNNAIIEARFYPIISQQEKIRKKMMVRIQEQKTKSEKWNGIICPNIFKKIKANIKRNQFLEVLWNGKDGFEVKHLNSRGRRYTVNLDKCTCSCGYFQLASLPCCHAICAIYKSGRKIEDYVDKCYYIDTFKKNYEHCLQPVEREESWPVSQNPRPVAPGYIAMPGARKKNNDRRREEGEAPKGKKLSKHGIHITCGSCGGRGTIELSVKRMEITPKKQSHILGRGGEKQGKQSKHRQMHPQAGLQELELQQDLKLVPLKMQQALKLQHPGSCLLEVQQQLTMVFLEVAELQAGGEAMAEEVEQDLGEGEAQKLGLCPTLQLVGIIEALLSFGFMSCAYGVAFWMFMSVCTRYVLMCFCTGYVLQLCSFVVMFNITVQ